MDARQVLFSCCAGELLTTEDESDAIIPGPNGRLISSEERMQHIRMVQPESPVPQPSPVPGRTWRHIWTGLRVLFSVRSQISCYCLEFVFGFCILQLLSLSL